MKNLQKQVDDDIFDNMNKKIKIELSNLLDIRLMDKLFIDSLAGNRNFIVSKLNDGIISV